MSLYKPNPDDPDEFGRLLDFAEDLQKAFESIICRASPHFEIPAQFLASAMLGAAIRVQMMALGDRTRVSEWVRRQAFAVEAQCPGYLGMGDEDEAVIECWQQDAERLVKRIGGSS